MPDNPYICGTKQLKQLIMKKELGKWLMDIAKYLMTAALLSSLIADMNRSGWFYLFVLVNILITLAFGLWLVRDKKEGE